MCANSAAATARANKREALIAKGVAGAVLFRFAATSRAAAIWASLASLLLLITPTIAVEAILLAALLRVLADALKMALEGIKEKQLR